MAAGTLIAESLRTPSTLGDLLLTLHAVERVEAGELSAAQTDAGLPRRVFHYRADDPEGRAAAEAHGRSVGVPESRLGWP